MLFRREVFLQTASEIMFTHTLKYQSNKGAGMCCSSLNFKCLAWQHRNETGTYFAIVGKEH